MYETVVTTLWNNYWVRYSLPELNLVYCLFLCTQKACVVYTEAFVITYCYTCESGPWLNIALGGMHALTFDR